MKIKCPHCNSVIPKKDIEAENYAFCENCRLSFDIVARTDIEKQPATRLFDEFDARLPKEIIRYEPIGTWLTQKDSAVVIGASVRSISTVLFWAAFNFIWTGGLTIGFVSAWTAGEMALPLFLGFSVFFIASVFLAIALLFVLFGKTEVILDGKSSLIFAGIGKIGKRKTFDWYSVTDIKEIIIPGNKFNNTSSKHFIRLECPEVIGFGHSLNEKKRSFIFNVLKHLHTTENGFFGAENVDSFETITESSLHETFASFKYEIPEKIIKNPPKGTWLKQSPDKIVIGASLRSWSVLVAIIPALFFAAFASYFTYLLKTGKATVESGSENVMTVILIIFWLVAVVIIIKALFSLTGRVEVIIANDSYVFTGLGNLGIKKSFDWKTVKNISAYRQSDREGYTDYLYIESYTKIIFGKQLSDKKKLYMLQVLRYLHENKI